MRTIHKIDELREQIAGWKHEGFTILFVPTMGNLHKGHLSLFDAAKEAAGGSPVKLVASVFVNPLQFGPGEDFDTYPRTMEDDAGQLDVLGVDLLFAPTVEEMYPNGNLQQTRVVPAELGNMLEGEHRPGFFTGVSTVVNKLFNMVQPDIAAFGQKDYQQLLVVRRMVEDLSLPVRVVAGPTMREHDGLAMSSRNRYLKEDERATAGKLNVCLDHLVAEVQKSTDCQYAVMHAMQELEAQGFLVDYVVVRRQSDLGVPEAADTELVALVAAKLGETRLLDNKTFSRSVA